MHVQGQLYQLVPRVQVCRQESSNSISGHSLQALQLGHKRCVHRHAMLVTPYLHVTLSQEVLEEAQRSTAAMAEWILRSSLSL